MHYEQIVKLAQTHRQIANASLCKPVRNVVGKSLWPRSPTEISCKNYSAKPLPAKAKARRESVRTFKRPSKEAIKNCGRVLDAAEVAALNDEYVALLAMQAAKHTRKLMVGEARI